MVDVEADGRIPGDSSMVALGAVVVEPGLKKRFYAELRPISDRFDVPKAGLKFQVTAMVCEVTGGPYAYRGRSMKEAHRHLHITEEEWQAMAADFKKTLDKFDVPEQEQKELFDIVGTTKGDIVAK